MSLHNTAQPCRQSVVCELSPFPHFLIWTCFLGSLWNGVWGNGKKFFGETKMVEVVIFSARFKSEAWLEILVPRWVTLFLYAKIHEKQTTTSKITKALLGRIQMVSSWRRRRGTVGLWVELGWVGLRGCVVASVQRWKGWDGLGAAGRGEWGALGPSQAVYFLVPVTSYATRLTVYVE